MTGPPASALPPAEDLTDRQLLERFVARREQAAFEAIVQRHGPAVLGVCRRELACEQDAEDVFQATFLVLARRAALIPWRDSIGHWLQAVARRLALRARCSAGRLRRCASVGAGGWPDDFPEPADPLPGPLAEAAHRERNLLIAEELGRLPEQYRAPVVLCYLQGKTNEQAANELGWPTGSMSRRLSRARALLRERLTRRGLGFVVLGCLALACLWMLARPHGPQPRPNVATAMAAFHAEGGEEGIERLLLRAADESRVNAEDRQRLTRVARQAARAADATVGHDPGRRRDDWRRLSEEMRTSAGELDEALAQDDGPKTQKAARRLAVTCQGCHASFRP